MFAPRKRSKGHLGHPFSAGKVVLVILGAVVITCIVAGIRLLSQVQEPLLGAGSFGRNQTEPSSKRHQALHDLIMGVSQSLEQNKEWQQKEEAQRREQFLALQKSLSEVRGAVARQEAQAAELAAQKASLDDLREKMEGTLHTAVAEQRGLLEEQNALLRGIHRSTLQREAGWEYKRRDPGKRQNFTLLTVTDDSLDSWEQRSFRKYGAYGFVSYSAYRVSRTQVTVLGLAARGMQSTRRLESCEWHSLGDSVIQGRLQIHLDAEHHSFMYQVAVLHCILTDAITEPGGFLQAKIDGEIMFLYRETTSQALDEPKQSDAFLFQMAYCGPPMFGRIRAQAVVEFIEYHYAYMGADHFVLYDSGGVTPEVVDAIGNYAAQGLVTITDFREASKWDVWVWAQSLAIHDCSYRLRRLAKWVFVQDLDEYFEAVPPQTVKGILEKHAARPWLTTGCLVFSVRHCDGGGKGNTSVPGAPLVGPMQFRWPHVYCQKDKHPDPFHCLGQLGHRKFIVNPRKVTQFEIHKVVSPAEGGVDLSVAVARQVHFQGLASQTPRLCDLGVPTEWWQAYDRVSRISQAVKECRRDPTTKLCYPGDIVVGPSEVVAIASWRKSRAQ